MSTAIDERVLGRAIYLDYEGCVGESPSLVGYLMEGTLQQVVLDARLSDAAWHSSLQVGNGAEVMAELVDTCRGEGRRLIGFTRHEVTMSLRHFGIDISPVYLDAHKEAKRGFRRLPPGDRPAGWSLEEMLSHTGHTVPMHLRRGNSTSRLRDVRDMLSRRGSYGELTPVVKAKWTKFLQHNAWDVRGLQMLLAHTFRANRESGNRLVTTDPASV